MKQKIKLNNHDIDYIKIKKRIHHDNSITLSKRKTKDGKKDIFMYVNYSTISTPVITGRFYDRTLFESNNYKFNANKRKMIYTIPYFENWDTNRINRNVRVDIVFSKSGWFKLMKYIFES